MNKFRDYSIFYKNDLEETEVVVKATEVKSNLDAIEVRVNEIKDMLDEVTGLNLIDEVKEKLEALSDDLY